MSGVIVYVDDEEMLCRAFSQLFRLAGYPIETFTRPHEAAEFVNTHPVALVICDYRMPELTGIDLLEHLDKDVPFFLVTGDLDVEQRVKDESRVLGVLSKPFPPSALFELVERYLGPSPSRS